MIAATTTLRRGAALCLCACLLLPLWPLRAVSQNRRGEQEHKRTIIVNAEQPNVWTLEQAHYLLAQMHRRNLDLKATGLGELDPNEINGLHFDVLRTLIEFGAAFNQADRFNNSLLTRDKRFDAERAIRLQNRRDGLREESLGLSRDIARLERERALADSQEQKDALTASIAELTGVRTGVDKEVERLDKDLTTATGPTGEVQATDAPAATGADKLPKSTFDEAFEDVTKSLIERFNQAPKLNATLRLENFLQMQYEIIAKQLTLLRDEVGPGERIIFLEMPQTVNASHDKSNKMWAQSWWKVVGYTAPKPGKQSDVERLLNVQFGDKAAIGVTGRIIEQSGQTQPGQQTQRVQPKAEAEAEGDGETTINEVSDRTTRDIVDDALEAYGRVRSRVNGACLRSGIKVDFRDLECPREMKNVYDGDIAPEDRTVRTIELIPRQSSLNVNDIKLQTRTGVLTAVAKTLFGFGARLNVQRQRETFSQFVQQELYSSAFGKGAREFGWTFNPMPGMDRLASGTRTTYAVLVVPAEAETLVVQSSGCYFPRSEYQPNDFAQTRESRWTDSDRQSRNCGQPKAFVVPIPGGGTGGETDFWVGGLAYTPVKKGESVSLIIYGKNFTPQTGLLVDGVPLTPAIGLAQPLIRDDSVTGQKAVEDLKDAKIRGRIERIATDQMVAVFERLDGKEGTPILTMTSPNKAIHLNRLRLKINGRKTNLVNAPWMIGKKPDEKEPFRIDRVEIFRARTGGNLRAAVSGAGFSQGAAADALKQIIINGSSVTSYSVDSPTLLRAEFPVPSDEPIRVTLVRNDGKTITSETVSNPARLTVTDVEVVTYEAETDDETATLFVRLVGSGFTSDVRASVDGVEVPLSDFIVKSATEALLKITDPEAVAVITLRDTQTGLETKTIVTRKTTQPK